MKQLSFRTRIVSVAMLALAFSFGTFLFTGCDEDDTIEAEKNGIAEYETPKYIFLLIGDGMAMPQINMMEAALNVSDFQLKTSQEVGLGATFISEFPVAGMSTTHAEDRYITGSAAAATALATGEKTTIGTISKTGDHASNIKTMAEMARDKGMRVGIISSVSIDHATPACFYAHEDARGNYNSIAAQMATSEFDYFAGGYAKGDFQKYRDRADNPKDIAAQMQAAGYTITTSRSELEAVQPGTKCWAYTGYDGSGALLYDMDRPDEHISLAEFTKKGIELLDNDKGFFMMVEAGKVDWACHANDVVSATHDMIAFDMAVAEAVAFYNQHPDETLIVITGDHECGGLTLGFSATAYETAFNILSYQKISYEAFEAKVVDWAEQKNVNFNQALDSLNYYFGLGNSAAHSALALTESDIQKLEAAFSKSMNGESVNSTDEYVIYGYYDPFTVTATHILNNKAGIDWTSYSHTGVPVPVFAKGQGQYEFSGYYDNTDVALKIIDIASLNK